MMSRANGKLRENQNKSEGEIRGEYWDYTIHRSGGLHERHAEITAEAEIYII